MQALSQITLFNEMHGTAVVLRVKEPDELGRYQLSQGQLQKARRTLCPDPECRKQGCGFDAAGQRGHSLGWLVDCNGKVRRNDLPSDLQIEIACRVPDSSKPRWPEQILASCYVGPYYKPGCGPTDSPAAGYLVWQRDELLQRFPASAMISSPQEQALHHATRWAKRQLEERLAWRAAALPELELES